MLFWAKDDLKSWLLVFFYGLENFLIDASEI
jgi:hypothetical protein